MNVTALVGNEFQAAGPATETSNAGVAVRTADGSRRT